MTPAYTIKYLLFLVRTINPFIPMKNFTLIFVLLFSFCAQAQTDSSKKETGPIPSAELSTTQQSVKINGVTIPLTARAGTLQLRDENNDPIALFGFTSYTREGANNPKRPIVFAYNGGPGSSSFWLHMGVLGPKRIVVNDPQFTPAAPYQIVNNDFSILDVADLVMMDPVGTGLSIPVGKAKFEDFWGVDQDIRSISLFITQYLIEYGRMNSPKYLLGESYGTFRNAGVMNRLLGQGIATNGVIMVSAVFDLRTLLFPPNDDLPYIVHFPTYAATAWYHNKIANKPSSLEAFLKSVREFTENEYAPALFKGDQLTTAERSLITAKLSSFSGVSADYWRKADLRVQAGEFFQELLRDEGNTVGRLDSRFKGGNQDLLSQFSDYDPQSHAISPAYITGFLNYFYNDLKVDKKHSYSTTAGMRQGFKWDWTHAGNMRWNTSAAINTGIDMATAMTRDPNVKVLILNGYYDIATVFYGVEHSINHLGLSPEIKKNIIMKYYEAGHMMYTHQSSLEKFKQDVSEFIQSTNK
ncbi:MAG: carboxypeptidase [Cyclobacteriaceae bacterium]|nr:carboxypeptidase [Cyclobacteriaceae bacterium]